MKARTRPFEGTLDFPGEEISLASSLRSPSVAPLVGNRARSGSQTTLFMARILAFLNFNNARSALQ